MQTASSALLSWGDRNCPDLARLRHRNAIAQVLLRGFSKRPAVFRRLLGDGAGVESEILRARRLRGDRPRKPRGRNSVVHVSSARAAMTPNPSLGRTCER